MVDFGDLPVTLTWPERSVRVDPHAESGYQTALTDADDLYDRADTDKGLSSGGGGCREIGMRQSDRDRHHIQIIG